MSHFWAKFQSSGGELFRLDTRIYLNNIDAPKQSDSCIGAIVGKNPGSAKPSSSTGEIQPIQLDGDKLLPTVRNIVTKAYVTAKIAIPERGYVQVLNLFYLCNPILSQAVETISQITTPPICKSESGHFPWVWYVWGDDHVGFRPHKERFSKIDADHRFFFDNSVKEVKGSSPQNNEFARHTQGLKHIYVVPYIAQLIENN
ncbi:hypothetical protein [Comamonas aquatica]|uniref:hypothetical protein n=1 Tax=Comamonas aquatica TaxID=225991 RepID=UPI002448412A|nr:hypothetical protein [Comamonas aquatica]MDH0202777.1 hypothetical protein [Comamonas aquatica]MDH1447865.1 hypothetical protein [Comamonas aquatica]